MKESQNDNGQTFESQMNILESHDGDRIFRSYDPVLENELKVPSQPVPTS